MKVEDPPHQNIKTIFHWLEHYHWGMVFLMFYHRILNGIGLSLILDENRSELGFEYEKDPKKRDEYYHFKESSTIGFVVFLVLMLRWVFL
ncbi:MAG: hypothetical protein ACE5HW_00805 [Candidatus Methanofastidiosia archaeon]